MARSWSMPCWVRSCPNGRRPYSIWNRITPTDHTSTCVSGLESAFLREEKAAQMQSCGHFGLSRHLGSHFRNAGASRPCRRFGLLRCSPLESKVGGTNAVMLAAILSRCTLHVHKVQCTPWRRYAVSPGQAGMSRAGGTCRLEKKTKVLDVNTGIDMERQRARGSRTPAKGRSSLRPPQSE